MYKITAIIHRKGGTPTRWTSYSRHPLTLQDCIKLLSLKIPSGQRQYRRETQVSLENFQCELMHEKPIPDDKSEKVQACIQQKRTDTTDILKDK